MTRGITGRLVSTGAVPLSGHVTHCKCAQCGKTFDKTSAEWAYALPDGKGYKLWYCSYKCMRAAEAARTTKRIKAHV